jgi:chemotaxis protein MotA
LARLLLIAWAMTTLSVLFDPLALAIVVGGTLVATAARGPVGDTVAALAAIRPALRRRFDAEAARAELAIAERLSQARGVLAVDAETIRDADVAAGVEAVVGGAGPDAIEHLLAARRAARRERHMIVHDWWTAAAETAPAMGMIGTLFGLVRMFQAMDDPATIGHAMAIALLATLYGAILANLFAAPLAARLQRLSRAEEDARRRLVKPFRAYAAREAPPTPRRSAA